ncbi:CLUMA_CG004368, isoform A [Clunio marinus]|uniref:CLUMA_CG004368, isoform A n=1 Tax=Clunio marinus TaxID=568069 RepID=A0A1J1HRQ8_9DIPT|nr:CLUMA_CG004368, isoform A [Clunio marinus]
MGFPDNRDIEPTRDDALSDYNNPPDFVMDQLEEEEAMEVEDDSNEGYSRLQNFENGDDYIPANDSDSSESDEEDENEYNFESAQNVEENASPGIPPIISSDVELQAQVWNTPRSQDTIELNNEKTQQILKAMSKFSLPNIPAWASEVDPTELVQRLKNKTTNDK